MMTLQGGDKNKNGNLTMEMLRLVNDWIETFNAIKTALNLPSICVEWLIIHSIRLKIPVGKQGDGESWRYE